MKQILKIIMAMRWKMLQRMPVVIWQLMQAIAVFTGGTIFAPYVKVQTPKGILSCVLDPSMFNKPVTKRKVVQISGKHLLLSGSKVGLL